MGHSLFVNTLQPTTHIWEINSIPKKDTTYLQYLDAKQFIRLGNVTTSSNWRIRWVDIESNEISELATQTDKGYILEVDVSYPTELHNPHNDLPLGWKLME